MTFYRINDTLEKRKAGGELHVSKNIAIKVARAEKDMTQKALAEAVGVSRQTINAIEKGEYNPTIKLCRKICRVLEKGLDDLFWRMRIMKKNKSNLDERQELKLLKIEHNGCWFAFWGLVSCDVGAAAFRK